MNQELEIKRYGIQWGGDYILYDDHIADNLTLDDVQSKKGMKKQTKIDFALRDRSLFETEKLPHKRQWTQLQGYQTARPNCWMPAYDCF